MAEQFRIRIRYQKTGRLCYLSHLEVIRTMERTVRRARVPFDITRGFSPHMRAVFGWALPVGTGSLAEYLDVVTTEYVAAEDLLARLKAASNPQLAVVDACYIGVKDPAPTEYYSVLRYEAIVGGVGPEEMQDALDQTIERGTLTVVRKKKDKIIDIPSMIAEPPSCEEAGGIACTSDACTRIVLATRASAARGCLRPELLLNRAFEDLRAGMDPQIVQLLRTDQVHKT